MSFLSKVIDAEQSLRKSLAPTALPVDPRTQRSYFAPELLNRKAYQAHLATVKPGGVHVAMDANHFKHLNDTFGHATGDSTIRAMGLALHGARLGTKGVVAHLGGDHFGAHFEDPEEAVRFATMAQNHLDALPPHVGPSLMEQPGHFHHMAGKEVGKPHLHQHRVSMAIGMGDSPEQAEQAKGMARSPSAVPGFALTAARSLHPAHAPEAAPVAKHEPDAYQLQLWEDELRKSTPVHDSVEPVTVYYVRDSDGPMTANGPVVQGWLELPELDYAELAKSDQYLAVGTATKVWLADVGVAFKL